MKMPTAPVPGLPQPRAPVPDPVSSVDVVPEYGT